MVDQRESILTEARMPYETILTDISENLFTITINRPDKLNALNTQMIHDLIDAFDKADADDAVRAIIVTGAGRAFCAGADLSTGGATFDRAARPDRPQVPNGPDGQPDLSHENARDGGGRITLRIFNCRKPVIAAVNGPAVGIGVTMLLPMDVRIASTDARFGFVFSQRGIVPEAASSWFLPRIVGIAQALDWCYSGRVFGADEALNGGLVSRVAAPGELIATARAIARRYCENTSAVSVALIRQMMWRMLGAGHPVEAHRIDSRAMFHRGRDADVKEGIASFLEKRPARFTDTVSKHWPDLPWGEEPRYR
jgi:enoyl-CoA hydratase/carnithine racemase